MASPDRDYWLKKFLATEMHFLIVFRYTTSPYFSSRTCVVKFVVLFDLEKNTFAVSLPYLYIRVIALE